MFERPHHRRIARILDALDGAKLRELKCWFGGGTAIALRHGEYRESVDIDFLVSDPDGYRQLRQRLAGAANIDALLHADARPVVLARDIRADQYGIRTALLVDDVRIKFEIIREARIALDEPARSDVVCDIATLTTVDLAASKLLANADRWRDDSAFSRDAIDLAMMGLPPRRLRAALDKAGQAYGDAVVEDMRRALDALRERPAHLERCIRTLAMAMPPAVLQQRLRVLRRRLERVAGESPTAD
ncbi:nucleotidyl transferase AbiEii/AbiGii toxin family protein [Rhodanobacter geophilus]|uniref:Nucleotidyl transferase AbiEii/AbiGii toxin family protein n=1 Tax=Rhodanobacter geophilus TaxID=3162488 RepID=A0ABV3QQN3_9GAMM